MKTDIYASFCGTGKSYLCDKYKDEFKELECWRYQEGDFPNNYVSDVIENIGKVKYLFISTNPVSLKRLNELGIVINLVYPDVELKDEYLNRYKVRKSEAGFIRMLDTNWNKWLFELKNQDYCKHIILKSGEYLQDIINE